MTSPVAGCPKRMAMGPCGGVRPDGGCEVMTAPCVFDGSATWPAVEAVRPLEQVPLVLTDFTSEPFSSTMHRRIARIVGPHADALLVGEHQNRPDLPPTMMAALLLDEGARPWITLTCRDRNRIVLEQELTGLRGLGVDTVLCVTGDARGYDVEPQITQVFDLDGTRLAALAHSLGLPAAVAETPTAPPRDRRPFRLLQKQRAGAAVAVLNYASTPAVSAFMADARQLGLQIPVIAAVPVLTDARSAAVLDGLPGLKLDREAVRRVLGSADPVQAGIRTAVDHARGLLAIDGIAGVNLSGLASDRGYLFGAEIKAQIGAAIREEHRDG